MNGGGLWLLLVVIVKALFRRDPIAFGRRLCELALTVLSVGLPPGGKRGWSDEVLAHIEEETWELSKRGMRPEQTGARLVWQALCLLIHGWGSRSHYAQHGRRDEIDETPLSYVIDDDLIRTRGSRLQVSLDGITWADLPHGRLPMVTLAGSTFAIRMDGYGRLTATPRGDGKG